MRLPNLISEIESSHRPVAIRFEPHVYSRTGDGRYAEAVEAARDVHGISFDTARMVVSTSWGFYQIMGFNLWAPRNVGGLEYKATYFDFLDDVEVQNNCFKMFCEDRKIYFSIEQMAKEKSVRELFAKKYNGSIKYADKIERILKREGLIK